MEREPDTLPSMPIPASLGAEYLTHYGLLPIAIEGDRVKVAAVGEPDPQALDDLSQLFGKEVEIVEIDAESLSQAIMRAVNARQSLVDIARDLEESVSVTDLGDPVEADERNLANQPPVIRYVNLLIRDAHEARASDIHIEVLPSGPRARFRVDGVLDAAEPPPASIYPAVVSRIKLLAELDISERRKPQDGRIRTRLDDHELDLRISTIPTLNGESVVLRLLDHGGRPATLEELGMNAAVYEGVTEMVAKPHGILLVTGPTGSGKTTTLYAALSLRDRHVEKIITVEDPIEYQLDYVAQVPVNAKRGVTFASALRSVLRQDPDVLMVGEMRDGETADIAIRAAMTGHLVLTTLHTNDAAGAIPRLIDLGVEDYLVSSTLEGVLAQRLVRKICTHCRTRYRPESQALALLAARPVAGMTLERGAGCERCRQTGYSGRTGIFELLRVTDPVREVIDRRLNRSGVRECAVEQGMITLKQDAWTKVKAGITTVEEVLRVVSN